MTPVPPPPPTSAARVRAAELARALREAGHEALFCGGAVRDRLLGRTPKDMDIATSAHPDQVAGLFPRAVMVGAQFGVVIVPGDGEDVPDVEVATFRADGRYVDGRRPVEVVFSDPATDAARRDFTINGLFEDPVTGEIQDHVGGLADLRSRLIRAIGDPHARFREDRLRILRAVRFAVQLNFAIEPATWDAVQAMAADVAEVSAERIRDELVPLLVAGRGRALRLLRDAGLLPVVLPEIAAMQGVPQGTDYHPEGDVFVHTGLVLDNVDLEGLAREDGIEDPEAHADLVLAALLHDVCKPDTFQRSETGRIQFHGHEARGRDGSRAILERLRLPRKRTERVEDLVGQHMKFGAVTDMREGKLRRFLGQEDIALHLRLHEADCSGSHGRLDKLDFCRTTLEAYGAEPVLPPPLLGGRDLLALGYAPGPRVGALLRWIRDEQLEGRLETAHDAARRVLEEHPLQPQED